MEAVLLAGGFGTRLKPLTYTTPKPLLPVGGRPMLEFVLDRLPKQVTKVIVAVNWLAEELETYFAKREPDGRTYVVVRETAPLGTAGAVANCKSHIKSDNFFVLNGDILSTMDLGAMLDLHLYRKANATISLRRIPIAETVSFGVAEMDKTDGKLIRGFVEKPATPAEAPSDLINAGAYILSRAVLELIPVGKMCSMEKEIFPQILGDKFYGLPFEGPWVDVGTPERLIAAHAELKLKKLFPSDAKIATTSHMDHTVAGPGLVVEAGAVATNCILGSNVRILGGAILRDCVVGDNEIIIGNHFKEQIWTKAVPAGYPAKQVGNAMKSS